MDVLNTRPDLLVGVSERLPEDFGNEALEELRASGANAEILRLDDSAYAGLELYLPTFVGLFILSTFFTGFVSKLGEDAYDSIKKGAKALYRKAQPLDVRMIGSRGKVKESGYSFAYAIGCELLPTLRVKMLIPKAGSPDEVEAGIDAFLDLMRAIHAGNVREDILEKLLRYPPVGGTVLMTYDMKKREIVPVDGFADTPARGPSAEERSD